MSFLTNNLDEWYLNILNKYSYNTFQKAQDSFNIIDAISAEKTISMWIHDEEVESNVDGSYDVQKSHGDHYFKLKQ